MVGVQQWAEIRRRAEVEGLSQRAISRRTGLHRKTIARALESHEPPSYSRPPKGSKLDPFKDEVHRLLKKDPEIPSLRIREEITELGDSGGKTICDQLVRELRPLHLCQFDLFEPSFEIPVGWGQTRRGWLVTSALGYSRAISAALIFSKTAPRPTSSGGCGAAWRPSARCPRPWSGTARARSTKAAGNRTDAFAAFCGALPAGWIILGPGDCQAKGLLERAHRFIRSSFEPARSFATELDYQAQLDGWVTERANPRTHQGIRAVPAERLISERQAMRPLPAQLPATAERFILRVPPAALFRFDRNDYSLDPRLVGRRVEIRCGQRAICAVSLDTGEIAARHRRSFAGGLTLPTQPTKRSSTACAASAPAIPRSRSALWPATTR